MRRSIKQLQSSLPRPLLLSNWNLRVAGGALVGLTAGGLVQAHAQGFFNPFGSPLAGAPAYGGAEGQAGAGDNFQITRGMPYNPTGGGATQHDYNFKLGSITASLSAGLSANYIDNYNQVPEGGGVKPEDELAFNPTLGIAFQWPINRDNTLHFDVGVGYSISVNHPEFNRLTISPTSSWDYQFKLGDVRMTVFDRLGSSGASGQRSDITGTGSASAVQFNRFSNAAGISAAWQPTLRSTFSVGYSMDLDYGLGDSFSSANHITHSLNTAFFQRLNAHWTAGVSGSAFINEYLQGIQNNSTGYGAGPTVTWQPSRFINFSGSVRYNVSKVQRTGTISDTNGSSGAGYDFSVQHTINRRLSHGFSVGSGIDLGVGVNFNQTFTIAYRASWQMTERLTLAFSANRQSFTQSGDGSQFLSLPPGGFFIANGPQGIPGIITPPNFFQPLPVGSRQFGNLIAIPQLAESAETYNFTLGTSFAVTRKLTASVGYGHILKLSNLPSHDYNQNSYNLSLSYRF
jgi:hypothetical protein